MDAASAPIYLVTGRIMPEGAKRSRGFWGWYGSCYRLFSSWKTLPAFDFDAEFPRPKTSLERRIRTSIPRLVRWGVIGSRTGRASETGQIRRPRISCPLAGVLVVSVRHRNLRPGSHA